MVRQIAVEQVLARLQVEGHAGGGSEASNIDIDLVAAVKLQGVLIACVIDIFDRDFPRDGGVEVAVEVLPFVADDNDVGGNRIAATTRYPASDCEQRECCLAGPVRHVCTLSPVTSTVNAVRSRYSRSMVPDLERITSDEYLAELEHRSLDDLRSMRGECQALENAASYVRRFAQARLDIIASGGCEAANTEDLVAQLSGALAGKEQVGTSDGSFARPPQGFEPGELCDKLVAKLDEVITPSQLLDVAAASPEHRSEVLESIAQFEGAISADRRTIHGVLDRLQVEIMRRYRDGHASVDALLGDG